MQEKRPEQNVHTETVSRRVDDGCIISGLLSGNWSGWIFLEFFLVDLHPLAAAGEKNESILELFAVDFVARAVCFLV